MRRGGWGLDLLSRHRTAPHVEEHDHGDREPERQDGAAARSIFRRVGHSPRLLDRTKSGGPHPGVKEGRAVRVLGDPFAVVKNATGCAVASTLDDLSLERLASQLNQARHVVLE